MLETTHLSNNNKAAATDEEKNLQPSVKTAAGTRHSSALSSLPDTLLSKLLNFLPPSAANYLMQTARYWRGLYTNEQHWRERVANEVTANPVLTVGQSYLAFYMRFYQGQVGDVHHSRSYKDYLKKIDRKSESDSASRFDGYLSTACRMGAEILVEKLIKKGAEVSLHNGFDAIRSGNVRVLDLLIKNGLDLNSSENSHGYNGEYNENLFLRAAISEHYKMMLERLLQEDDKIISLPALHKTAAKGDTQGLSELLVDGSYPVNQLDACNTTALWWALMNGQTECVRLLIEAKARLANIGKDPLYGNTSALMAAITRKDEASMQAILEAKPDITETFSYRYRPVHLSLLNKAAEYNFVGGLRLLTQQGLRINNRSWEYTALHSAAEYGSEESLRWLLENGAEINRVGKWTVIDEDGKDDTYTASTALFLAADHGHPRCVLLLLQFGADPSIDGRQLDVHRGEKMPLVTTSFLEAFLSSSRSYQMDERLSIELKKVDYAPTILLTPIRMPIYNV